MGNEYEVLSNCYDVLTLKIICNVLISSVGKFYIDGVIRGLEAHARHHWWHIIVSYMCRCRDRMIIYVAVCV